MLFKMKKGFTLIELLVVIGVLAVIAAGVVALINPQDKLRQASDSKVSNDVGQLATALQSSAAQNPTGLYPAALNDLATTGELVTIPTQPGGGAYTYTGGGTAVVRVCGTLTSLKYTAGTPASQGWAWCSSTGRAGPVANCAGAACP